MITIAPMNESYLHRLWEIGYRQAAPRWKEFAAPILMTTRPALLLKTFEHWNSTSGYKKIASGQF